MSNIATKPLDCALEGYLTRRIWVGHLADAYAPSGDKDALVSAAADYTAAAKRAVLMLLASVYHTHGTTVRLTSEQEATLISVDALCRTKQIIIDAADGDPVAQLTPVTESTEAMLAALGDLPADFIN